MKHENHTPIGAFKVRGGIVYLDALKRRGRSVKGVVTATRGNHGQSIALAAARAGMPCTIFVPRGNSREKNAAMQAFGAELIVAGADFDESRRACGEVRRRSAAITSCPRFTPTWSRAWRPTRWRCSQAKPDLDAVYVPIGMGSGICGLITVRDLLGLDTEIIGVVAEKAPAVALSFERAAPCRPTRPPPSPTAWPAASRMPEALAIIQRGAARIVRVREDEIAEAMRACYEDTHNLAEGAGAAALAALLQERDRMPASASAWCSAAAISTARCSPRCWPGERRAASELIRPPIPAPGRR